MTIQAIFFSRLASIFASRYALVYTDLTEEYMDWWFLKADSIKFNKKSFKFVLYIVLPYFYIFMSLIITYNIYGKRLKVIFKKYLSYPWLSLVFKIFKKDQLYIQKNH